MRRNGSLSALGDVVAWGEPNPAWLEARFAFEIGELLAAGRVGGSEPRSRHAA